MSEPLDRSDPDRPPPGGRDPLERLGRLNATSERELLEGHGTCGRCGGTGVVEVESRFAYGRTRDCPRCDGTGRKPAR